MSNLLSNQHVRRRRIPGGKNPYLAEKSWSRKEKAARPVMRKRRVNQTMDENPQKRKSGFSLSMPLLPLGGICVFAAVLILAASGRDTLPEDWMSRDVIPLSVPESGTADYNMALYTGLSVQTPPETGGTGITVESVEESPAGTIPLDLTETLTWKTYTVKKGDSVSKIATAFALSMDAVIAANNISNARLLRQGETLRIPNMDGIPYIVKKGDSLSRISASMGVPLEAILDANNIERDIISVGETIFIPGARMKSEDLKLAMGDFFAYPVKGARLSSPFGWRNDPISGVRRHHGAVDLAAPTGTLVKAASGGTVSSVGYNANYGKYVILSHGSGMQTLYAHLSVISVSQGKTISQGEKIGEVGSTGYSTGPHLHFGVYKNGRAVNPLDFLHS